MSLGQRRAGVAVDVADQHLGALGGEAPGQALPQPGRATGDDRDLAFEFVAHLAGCPLSIHVAEELQQQLVDGGGLFDLRAVAGAFDHGRAAPRDLLGDLGRPAPAAAVCRTRPRPPGSARRCARRRACSTATAAAQAPACGTWPPPTPPTRRARCLTRSVAARRRRRPGTPGRGRARRRCAACPSIVAS